MVNRQIFKFGLNDGVNSAYIILFNPFTFIQHPLMSRDHPYTRPAMLFAVKWATFPDFPENEEGESLPEGSTYSISVGEFNEFMDSLRCNDFEKYTISEIVGIGAYNYYFMF